MGAMVHLSANSRLKMRELPIWARGCLLLHPSYLLFLDAMHPSQLASSLKHLAAMHLIQIALSLKHPSDSLLYAVVGG